MPHREPVRLVHYSKFHGSVLCCLALALAACETGSPGQAAPTIRDSAGVHIVENHLPRWAEGEAWRLPDRPALDIGVLEGDSNYQLFQVAGALRLSDGRIVVANAGSGELRFYDADGTFLSASGRKGGGPGEFQVLRWLGVLAGDSLLTYDGLSRRISVFDPGGGFVRSSTLQLGGVHGLHVRLGPLSDRTLLVSVEGLFAGEFSLGLLRDTTALVRCDLDGAMMDTVVQFRGREMYVASLDEHVDVAPLAFGRDPRFATYDGGFYLGSTESHEVAYYGPDARIRRIVRFAGPAVSVTPSDIDRFLQEQLADVTDDFDRQILERFYADMPFPQTMPTHGDLLVDAEGNLWVEEYRRPGDDQPRWRVFDADGALLGVVETPPDLTIYQIGPDFVLGRWIDELDVEHVRLYALLKS